MTIKPDHLQFRYKMGSGCSAIIGIFVLVPWIYILVLLGRGPIMNRGLPIAFLVVLAVGGFGFFLLASILRNLFERQELRIDGQGVDYSRQVIIMLDRQHIPIDKVDNIELAVKPGTQYADISSLEIDITSSHGMIVFGRGDSKLQLALLAGQMRNYVESHRAKPLLPAPRLEAALTKEIALIQGTSPAGIAETAELVRQMQQENAMRAKKKSLR